MFIKIFHFLSLFAYLNILAYEPADPNLKQDSVAGESMLEIVLDDLMDIPIHTDGEDIEIQNEKYRVFQTALNIMPAVLLLLALFLFKQIGKVVTAIHPFYKTKSTCRPSYYTHLFRLKPF